MRSVSQHVCVHCSVLFVCLFFAGSSKSAFPDFKITLVYYEPNECLITNIHVIYRSSSDGIIESLEVVTLSNDVPVKRFAQQKHLPVHSWPPQNVDGRFDVGVVVSFGCLLQERLIKKFP